MWKRIIKNRFDLDFGSLSMCSSYIYLPNLDGKLITYKINKYNMIKNNSCGLKTLHAKNKSNNAIITIYENYIDVFVITDNGNYIIKHIEKNLYEVSKTTKDVRNIFNCNVLNSENSSDSCCGSDNSNFMKKNDDNVRPKPRIPAQLIATEFTFGDTIREYNIIYGLTSSYKDAFGNNPTTLWNKLVHITNIINIIFQNNFSCYFIINQDDQMDIINSTDFDNFTSSDITNFTPTFNNIINSNNYDIGHVLSSGSGGLAYLNSLCSSNKGAGWTASPPTNDQTFVIDYMCHELGHQFGCNHIHQRCNNTTFSTFEPGSGSTIMGYTGICTPNVQNDSDPYFNRYNIWEAKQHMESTSCAVEITHSNPIPLIGNNYNQYSYPIPNNTTFELYADSISNISSAYDVFYTWEGIDLGSANFDDTDNKAKIRSKMLKSPYRTIANIPVSGEEYANFDKLTEASGSTANIFQIKLINDYAPSVDATWEGTMTITHSTSTTEVPFTFTGSGGNFITINFAEILWYPTKIDFQIDFSANDLTWASDLLVVLVNSNNTNILKWGGTDYVQIEAPDNSNTWSNSLQSTNNTSYTESIQLDNVEINTFSFQLTVRALYYYDNINDSDNNLVPYNQDYFSTIASKKLLTVVPIESDGPQFTDQSVTNNVISLIWDVANTDINLGADTVSIYVSDESEVIGSEQNFIWNYKNPDTLLYTGPNNGSASIVITNSNLFNKDIKLKIKFNNNLFILVSDTFFVNITNDNIPPVITLLGNSTINHDVFTQYNDPGATATDNNDGNITNNIVTVNNVNSDILGSYSVIYTVSDNAGNTGEVIRTVNVIDTTSPVITLIGSSSIDHLINTTYTDDGATATDNYDGVITANIVTVNNVNTSVLGQYTVTYNVIDSSNNAATEVVRTVNVIDTTSPVITLIGNSTISQEVNTTYNDAGATANDTNDGDITSDIVTVNNVDTSILGTYTVTYNVTNSSGISASEVIRTVNVIDSTPPVITLIGQSNISHLVNTTYNDDGATASDNYNGDITSNIVIVNNVNTSVLGTYTVTYNVSDTWGNDATEVIRTVNIIDSTPPVITLIGQSNISHIINTSYNDAGATAIDNYDGDITSTIVVVNNVNTSVIGTYTVTYNVSDNWGNVADEVVRTVNIIDSNIPIITLIGNLTINHEVNTQYNDAGATANDSNDCDITSNIVTVNNVNISVLGTYTVTYNVSDSSGNAATEVIRTVNIVDTTIPVITLTGNSTINHEVNIPYNDFGATATDNYNGNVSANIVTVNNVNISVLGTYTVTYNVSDSSGNVATEVVRTVNVIDATPPVITLIGSSSINHQINTQYIDNGATATDNYDGNITNNIVTVNNVDINTVGTYTVTYNVSDSSTNNAIEVVRTVNVISNNQVGQNLLDALTAYIQSINN